MLAKPWLTSNYQELVHCLRAQFAGKKPTVSTDVILQKSMCVQKGENSLNPLPPEICLDSKQYDCTAGPNASVILSV